MSRTGAVPAPRSARPSGVYAMGRTDARAEREAERTADTVVGAGGLFSDWSFAAAPPALPAAGAPTGPERSDDRDGELAVDLPGPGRPLDPRLAAPLQTALGADL